MKTLLVTVFALVVAFNSFAQKPAPTTKAIQQIERKADSVNAALNTSIKKYQATVDSINNAKLIEALKNSNELQNGNNTYYSVPIALLTFIVTVFAIIIGINAFSVAATHRKEMREQRQVTSKLLQKQKEEYDEEYDELKEGYKKVVEGYADFEGKYKVALETVTKNAEDKLKALDNLVIDGGDATGRTATEKEVEEVKKMLVEVRNMQAHLNNKDNAVMNYLETKRKHGIPTAGTSGFASKLRKSDHKIIAQMKRDADEMYKGRVTRCSSCDTSYVLTDFIAIYEPDLVTTKCPQCGTLQGHPLSPKK